MASHQQSTMGTTPGYQGLSVSIYQHNSPLPLYQRPSNGSPGHSATTRLEYFVCAQGGADFLFKIDFSRNFPHLDECQKIHIEAFHDEKEVLFTSSPRTATIRKSFISSSIWSKIVHQVIRHVNGQRLGASMQASDLQICEQMSPAACISFI